MGLVIALTTGYWQMLGFAVLQAVVHVTTRRVGQRTYPKTLDPIRDVRIRNGRITARGRRLPRLIAFWNPETKRAVVEHIRSLDSIPVGTQLAEFYSNRRRGHLVLGLAGDKPLLLDWSRSPHTLIVGPTGSGKSALLARLLSQLAADSFEVWLFDYKAGELISDNSAVCARFRCADSSDAAGLALGWAELMKRVDRLSAERVPRVVVIIEELAAALADRSTAEVISRLAAQGRSVGVRIIVTNQTATGVPRQLLVNLGNRIVLAGADLSERILLSTSSDVPSAAAASQVPLISRTSTPGAQERDGIFLARLVSAGIDFRFLSVWSKWGL